MNLDLEEVHHLAKGRDNAKDQGRRIEAKRAHNGCVLDVLFWILIGAIDAKSAIKESLTEILAPEVTIGNARSVTT